MLAAGGCDRLFAAVVGIKIQSMAMHNGVTQFWSASDRGVLGEVRLNGSDGGIFDVLWGGEVRLPGAEINHVDALAPQPVGLSHYCHGGGGLDAVDAFGQSDCLGHFRGRRRHFFLPLVLVVGWNLIAGSSFARSLCSTLSGTRPLMDPPSCAISRTRRELRYE